MQLKKKKSTDFVKASTSARLASLLILRSRSSHLHHLPTCCSNCELTVPILCYTETEARAEGALQLTHRLLQLLLIDGDPRGTHWSVQASHLGVNREGQKCGHKVPHNNYGTFTAFSPPLNITAAPKGGTPREGSLEAHQQHFPKLQGESKSPLLSPKKSRPRAHTRSLGATSTPCNTSHCSKYRKTNFSTPAWLSVTSSEDSTGEKHHFEVQHYLYPSPCTASSSCCHTSISKSSLGSPRHPWGRANTAGARQAGKEQPSSPQPLWQQGGPKVASCRAGLICSCN